MKKYILIFIVLVLSLTSVRTYGQGTNCLGATPLCSSVTTTFPATIGGTVPAGNNYGCLGSQPNPSWFTLTIGTSGSVTINQTGPCDQDYAVWGPFNTLSAACSGLTAAPVSCNYSTAANNTFTLTGTTGQIFIMLFTNFGGCSGNVTISEAAGGGSLSCVPVCGVTASNLGPYCSGTTITLNATAANGATAYTWTGPNGFTATGQNVTIPNCNASMAGVYTVTATGAATCSGSTTVVVNPTPAMNPTVTSPACIGSPITLCAGAPAGALVAWTGPAFAALNPCPTIPSATLANAGNYTVTVLLNGCQSQQILPVVVTAAPTVTTTPNATYCSGATVPATTFTGTPANATFTWTNNQTSIGLAASGSAGTPSFTATNTTSNPIIATVSVVPHLGSCNGTSSNFTITVNPVPALTAPASNVYCEGAQFPGVTWNAAAGSTISWTNSNPAIGLPASGTGNIPAFTTSLVNAQTVATITATPSQGACVGNPVTFTITVNNAPSAAITDIGPLCSNAGFQNLVAATSGGTWSGPGIINTSSGLFNPLTAGAGTHTITYTVNLPNQCPATDVTQIQVISVPIANAGLNQSVCQGQTINLNGSFSNSNTGSETFAWTPTTNLTNTTTLTPTYTANSTQTYTLTVTSGSCSSTDNVVITTLPQSNATINAAGPYCANVAPVTLTAAQTGGTWSGPGITSASAGTFNPATANVGNNTITYSIGGSCPSTDTQIITVYAVPSPTINPAGPYCQSSLPVTLTAVTPGGTWSGTGINNTSTGSFGSTTLAASTYTVTYNTGGNCPQTSTLNIVVNANTNATINAAGPYCADVAPVILTAAQAGGTWSGTGITNASTGAFNPASATIGNNTITYSIGGPCPSTDTQVITVYAVPNGAITPSGPYCQSSLPVTLTAATPGGTWSGTGINNASTGSFGSPTLAANTYAITYTTSGNCPRTFNQNIVVNASTNATINAAGPYCADVAPVILTAAQTGGTWSGTGITNPSTGAFNPASATVGNNTITYSIGGPCPSTDTQVITVYAVPNGAITPSGPYCQSSLPVTLTAATPGGTWSGTGINNASTGSFGSPTLAANTYAITYTTSGNCPRTFNQNIVVNASTNATINAAGPFCTDDPAVVLTAAQTGGTWSGSGITNTSTGAFNPASATAGNNTITYSIGGPCPSTDTQIIVVNSLPNATINPAGPYCQSSLPVTLTAVTPGGTWSGTGINNTSTGSFGSTTLAASTYTVTYNTGGNCPQTSTLNIVVNANTNATINAAGPYCADVAPVVLTAAQAGGTWSGAGITNASTGAFNPASATVGNNTITYSIGGPCPSTDTQVITVYAVPNGAITPSGPYCQSSLPVTLTAATPGGTWSGTGINNASTGSFGSPTLAANTYAITYTTSGNCPRTFNQNIVVNASTNATINAAGPYCADVAPVVLTAAQAGGTWSGSGITNTSTGAFDPAQANIGNNTITYSIGGPCPSTDTQLIVIYSVPDGTITPVGPFCQSELPITLTAASSGGTWSGTGINNASTGSFGSTTLAANTYNINYNTGGNCPHDFTTTVVVNANVDATITPQANVCADAPSLTFIAAQSGGTWSGNGITDPTTGAFNPASVTPGLQTITYSIAGACPDTDTQTIEVYPVFDGTITPAGPFCQSDLPIVLSAASTGGTWSGTGINNTSTGSFGSSTLAGNTYTVTYTTGGNCPRVFNETVVVNANVDATISNVAPMCADVAAFNLSAADPGGTWSGTGITDAVNGTFDPSQAITGQQTITYSISGACPDTDTQIIEVYPVYDGTITPVGPFCQSDLPITMTAASSGGTWSGTGINSASSGSFGSTSLAPNTYTVTYTTQGNCSAPFTTTVVVNGNVDATISPVADVCNDALAFNMSAVDAGGTWTGQGVSAVGTFTPTSVIPGTYTITYSIGGACPDTDTQDVVVLDVPDGTITPAGPFCQDVLPQTLTAASAGGTWSGTGITSAANGTFGASNTPAGNYSITYTTPGQCSHAFNQVVQVIENLDATISSAGPFCEDAAPVTLIAASPGGVWSGTGVISTNGQINPGVLGPGIFTFNYNLNNSGCLSSDNVQITVNPLPQPSFSASTTSGCSPLSVTFTNTSNPLGSSCVWYVNGSPAGNGNSHSEIFTGNSCEDIGILITDAAGCSQSVTMTDLVCVYANPSASFTWSPLEPMLGGTVTFDNASLGGTTYTWEINGQGASGESVTYNVPSGIGSDFQACLEVVGPGGCMDTQCYTVTVSSESYVFVPNSFTPDADGTNDVFAPVIAGLTDDYRYTLRIYDRWGDVIFETNDPSDVWTGNVHNGSYYAQADAYVYEITLQLRAGEPPFRKVGSVVLIR